MTITIVQAMRRITSRAFRPMDVNRWTSLEVRDHVYGDAQERVLA